MSINYIGSGGLTQLSNLKTTGMENVKKNEEVENTDFSAAVQQTQKVDEIENTVLAQRAEKVAAIKEQVEAGLYKPDSEQVARSLANFLLDSE